MSTVNQQITDSVSKVNDGIADQVVPAMDRFIDKISPAIAALSEKLGTTAEMLFGVLVKQSYNYAIGNLIIIIFASIGLYFAFYGANIWKKKIVDEGWHKDGWGGLIAIKISASIIGTIIITANTINMIQKLINPEFYALHTILQYIK